MSLVSNLNQTCTIYRVAEGASYPPSEAWSVLAADVRCLKSVDDRREVLDDGTIVSSSRERVRMEPRDLTTDDRIYMNGDVYEIDGEPADVDGLGRELVMAVNRLPEGTAGEMGIA